MSSWFEWQAYSPQQNKAGRYLKQKRHLKQKPGSALPPKRAGAQPQRTADIIQELRNTIAAYAALGSEILAEIGSELESEPVSDYNLDGNSCVATPCSRSRATAWRSKDTKVSPPSHCP